MEACHTQNGYTRMIQLPCLYIRTYSHTYNHNEFIIHYSPLIVGMISLKKERIVMEKTLACTHVRVYTKHRKNCVLC